MDQDDAISSPTYQPLLHLLIPKDTLSEECGRSIYRPARYVNLTDLPVFGKQENDLPPAGCRTHCVRARVAVFVSPDLAAKHASTNISPEGLQLGSTGTMLTANVPTVVEYTTHLLNAQSLSRKHSIMRHASRQLLSRYLQSLRKARPLLAATQSARSSPYHRGQGSLGPN
jgi:hypothetical protein